MWSDNAEGVQMAISTDGIIWTTLGQASGLLNPRHTVVEKIGNEYRIWYDEGSDAHLYSIEAIRTASSSDGLTWNDDQPLTQDDNCQLITGAGSGWNRGSYGPGDVIYNPSGSDTLDDTNVWNNKYVMYYMATTGILNEYIGLAYSTDGKHWKRYGDAPVLSPCTEYNDPSVGWDYRSVGYPTVIKDGGGIWHMWFCGGPNTNHGIGYAWSNDGINWVKDADNPIFHKGDGVSWRDDRTYTPMVIGDQMWFSGKDVDTGVYAIGYATAPCTPVSIVYLTEGPLLARVNTEVSFEATIVGGCGQIDALWDFEPGTGDEQSESGVTNPVTATYTYTSAGIYEVYFGVSDDSSPDIVDFGWIIVVVYDPTGGFVTGGGWIDSPPGAYMADASLAGRANFGFVSKYKKGATVPTGKTEFVFHAGDLNFHSSSYQWLVVNQAGSNAQFKGSGTINGDGYYKFMLWAGDGDPDTFRIKIWGETEDMEWPIYDNDTGGGSNQPISGGNIVIHKK
jgi:hypothetical protein